MQSTLFFVLLVLVALFKWKVSSFHYPSGINGLKKSLSPIGNGQKWKSTSFHATTLALKNINKSDFVSPHSSLYSTPTNRSNTIKMIAAKGLGYAMCLGALGLHSPTIYSLMRYKNTDGMSIQSWMFSLIGVTLAMFQPYRKGYPLSTYIELMAIAAQCGGILGLISFYRGNIIEYILGMTLYGLFAAALFIVPNISHSMSQAVQIVSLILCNYSNIPQIVLSFQTKSTSWSAVTALFSMTGCAVRVFTTLSLTAGDRLALLGYVLGVLSNGILLAQVVMYGKR